jgi:hypothetical protein
MRVGYERVHPMVDDHSRCAYRELHRDERAETVTGFVERTLAHFAEVGIERSGCSDNAWTSRHNRSLRELLQAHRIDHLLHPVPAAAGRRERIERHQRTLKREWRLGRVYCSSGHRAACGVSSSARCGSWAVPELGRVGARSHSRWQPPG